MNEQKQQTSNDYGIEVSPLPQRVMAYHGETLLASSAHAKVMYETRLPPTVYFPIEDVAASLIDTSPLKTFCPFKGTAEYFHLDLPEERLENAVWSYRNALPEGKGVEGHVAFMPNIVTDLDLGSNQFDKQDSGNISGPIIDWIMGEAWLCKSPEELTAAIAKKLLSEGIAISRFSVLIWSLHPMIAGRNFIWTRKTDAVETFSPSYDIHKHPEYINSPLRHVSNGLGGVRQRLDGDDHEFSFPIMDDLKAEGCTDYVAMPLPFSNGQINVMTLTCDHPKGFTTPNLGLIFETLFVLSRHYEVFALKENAQSLLETYLGKRTGARVLGGEIRRGDGDEIEAAILFCDLRNSTLLEGKLGRAPYIELLNRFLESVTDIINEHDGEVLKFIGDAVLAIFPSGKERAEACKKALDSAIKIAEKFSSTDVKDNPDKIDCSIGIAFGEVTYGNVGSRERLDFTVIGAAANIAARLGDWGKTRGHRITVSQDIASTDGNAVSLGNIELHNVSKPVATYAIATSASE